VQHWRRKSPVGKAESGEDEKANATNEAEYPDRDVAPSDKRIVTPDRVCSGEDNLLLPVKWGHWKVVPDRDFVRIVGDPILGDPPRLSEVWQGCDFSTKARTWGGVRLKSERVGEFRVGGLIVVCVCAFGRRGHSPISAIAYPQPASRQPGLRFHTPFHYFQTRWKTMGCTHTAKQSSSVSSQTTVHVRASHPIGERDEREQRTGTPVCAVSVSHIVPGARASPSWHALTPQFGGYTGHRCRVGVNSWSQRGTLRARCMRGVSTPLSKKMG
jgi:hypothetical protein